MQSKPPSKRGQCGKNAIPKRGFTPGEEKRVEKITLADRGRWKALMSEPLNQWKPVK